MIISCSRPHKKNKQTNNKKDKQNTVASGKYSSEQRGAEGTYENKKANQSLKLISDQDRT